MTKKISNFTNPCFNLSTLKFFFNIFIICFFLLLNILSNNVFAQNQNSNIYQPAPAPNYQAQNPPSIAPKPYYPPIPNKPTPNNNNLNQQAPSQVAITPSPTTNSATNQAPQVPNDQTQNVAVTNSAPQISAGFEIKQLPKNDYFGPKIGNSKPKRKVIKTSKPKFNPNAETNKINNMANNLEQNFKISSQKKSNSNKLNTQNNNVEIFNEEDRFSTHNSHKKTNRNIKNSEIDAKKYDINPHNYHFIDQRNAQWLSFDSQNSNIKNDENFIVADKIPIEDDFKQKYHNDLIIDNVNKATPQNFHSRIIITTPKISNHNVKLGIAKLNGEYIHKSLSNSSVSNYSKNQIKNLLISNFALENHFFSRILRTNLAFSKSITSANKSKSNQDNYSNPNNTQQVTGKILSNSSNNFLDLKLSSSFQIYQDYFRFNLGYKYNQLRFEESTLTSITSSNIASGNILDTTQNHNPVKVNRKFNAKYKIPFIGLEIKLPIIPKITTLKISSNYSNKASITNKILDIDHNLSTKTNFRNAKFYDIGIELENKISKNFTLNLNYNLQKINLVKSKTKIIDGVNEGNALSTKFSNLGINIGYNF